MSKTLFNTNTFQSKNVSNSTDIGTLKVETFKATNAIITNLTNAELQAATSGVSTNAGNISTNTSNISTNTSNISTNTSNIATNTSNISTNTSNIATNTSNIATNTSNISTNTSDITDLQNNKQDTLTAGTNITIDAGNVISATDTNTTYSAETNGALALNGSNEFSVDFSNTNTTVEIPQKVHIEVNGTPQLLVEPANDTANTAEIEIRGARNGSTSANTSVLTLSNYDNDIATTNKHGCFRGKVEDTLTNIGGLVMSSYSNGSTRTGRLTLSSSGNFNIGGGDTFQDDYKLKVTGDTKLDGLNYIKPQLHHFAYDKDRSILSGNWGNGSTQTVITSDREVGDSFCGALLGAITFTKNGYYRIRVSAQTQSVSYNDRVSFMNYLRIVKDGVTTNYDENENYNFFGWIYIRNQTDGGHGSCSFEDYIYLESGDTITPRHKLETTSDRNFNNTLSYNTIVNYLNITIERIYDEDPEV